MTDREQIRRKAEAMIAIHGDNATLAHGVLALLAELEQAERERDLARDDFEILTAMIRGAKPPALVQAARNAKSWIENYPLNMNMESDWAAVAVELDAALAAWEAE